MSCLDPDFLGKGALLPCKAVRINKETVLCKCPSLRWAGEEKETVPSQSHEGTPERPKGLSHHRTPQRQPEQGWLKSHMGEGPRH